MGEFNHAESWLYALLSGLGIVMLGSHVVLRC